MSAEILRFPGRRSCCVRIVFDGAWVVIAGNHSWAHGDFRSAMDDAHWLARNMNLPIRSATT